jgi:hypothetical protein
VTAPAVAQDRCRSCQAPIIWAVTERGRDTPVNAEPSADGSIALVDQGAGRTPLARVLKVADRFGRTNLRRSHFADCPSAPKWRKR